MRIEQVTQISSGYLFSAVEAMNEHFQGTISVDAREGGAYQWKISMHGRVGGPGTTVTRPEQYGDIRPTASVCWHVMERFWYYLPDIMIFPDDPYSEDEFKRMPTEHFVYIKLGREWIKRADNNFPATWKVGPMLKKYDIRDLCLCERSIDELRLNLSLRQRVSKAR